MANNNIRKAVIVAVLAAAPVVTFAAPAAAQGSIPWHQSGAGGSLHQSGAGGTLHQGSIPWHQSVSGADVADATAFDARF